MTEGRKRRIAVLEALLQNLKDVAHKRDLGQLHTFDFTMEEVYILRDAVAEEKVRISRKGEP